MTGSFKRANRYTWINNTAAAVLSNDVVPLVNTTTGICGVALTNIAIGASGELAIGGGDERATTLVKNTGEVFTDMQLLYWDVTNKRLTGTAGSNARIGRSYGVFNSAAASAQVILGQF